MATIAIRREERAGLVLAALAHAALLALLVLRPVGNDLLPPPERISVTLAPDIAPQSTAPKPAADPAPDVAPVIGEPAAAIPEPAPAPLPLPPPKPQAKPEPKPEPKPLPKPVPVAKPVPRVIPSPSPRPVPKAITPPHPAPAPTAKPAAKPSTAARPNPRPSASANPTAKPASRPGTAPAARPATRPGGSRVGDDFLKGVSGTKATGAASSAPAAVIGPAVQSALSGAISRQLKPHWAAPQGADAEKLVTILRFRLARDGSLAGTPEIVSQSGETPANAAQKQRHAEQAIRAVRLAAPFNLPEEYYAAWQTVTSRFDKRLSQ